MRVVSLLPSATEIVYALGRGGDLVGVSHECDYPTDTESKPRMIEPVIDTTTLSSDQIDARVVDYVKRGESLYGIRFEALKKAAPDLIITQELCNVCAIGANDVLTVVNKLRKPVTVLSLNPHTLSDVRGDIRKVAEAMQCPAEAERVIASLDAKANRIRDLTKGQTRQRVLCVEWLKPLMNAGHWMPEILEYAGGVDQLAVHGQPSTYLKWNSVLDYDPEVVILMPCGFTTQRTLQEAPAFLTMPHVSELSAVRNGRIYATDGNSYFSRSGPRLFDAIEILAHLLHPQLFNEPLNSRLATTIEICM